MQRWLAGWGFALKTNQLRTLGKDAIRGWFYGLSTFSDEWDGGVVSEVEGRMGSWSVGLIDGLTDWLID